MQNWTDRSAMARILGVLVILMVGAGCTGREAWRPTEAEIRLVELMSARLELARYVAWTKFQDNQPVFDPAREAELLTALRLRGGQAGVSAARVDRFFSAQMRASRLTQQELIRGWKRGNTLPAYPPWDLKKHIRPRLDAVSAEMLVLLKDLPDRNPGLAGYAERRLREQGASFFVARAAAGAFR